MTDVSVLSDSELVANLAVAARFLRELDGRPEARFDLATKHPSVGGMNARTFFASELDGAEFANWLCSENAERDVYVTVNAAREGTPKHARLGKKDIGLVRAVWVDIDPKGSRTKADAQSDLMLADEPPTIATDSGNGDWGFWVLPVPLTVESFNPEGQLRALAAHFGADDTAAELSRLARLPGTVNRKAGKALSLATVTRWDGPKADLAALAAWCPPSTQSGVDRTQNGKADFGVEMDHPAAVARATAWLITEAPEAVEGEGGNFATYKVAARLKDFGLSQGMIFDLMLDHWNPVKAMPPWEPDALGEIVRNVYRYGTAAPGKNSPALAGVEFSDETATVTGKEAKPLRPAMSILFSDEIWLDLKATTPHLIRGWQDQQTLAITYGESNTGKTHVVLDQGLAIAQGRRWAGHDTQQGLVVFIAAEGGKGIFKRYMAHQRKRPDYDWSKVPFALIPHPLDLLRGVGDVNKVVDLVKRAEDRYGQKCKLLDLDTVSRALAGGDENSSVDMGKFVGNLDRLRELTGAALHAVHHSGKNTAKGARGHSLLRAATDTEIEVADFTISCRKQRDQEFAEDLRFRYEPVEIGEDDVGAPVKSVVLDVWQATEFEIEMTPAQREVWEAACAVITRKTQEAQNDSGRPPDPRTLIVTPQEVASMRGGTLSKASLERAFPHLVEIGVLAKGKRGQYYLNRTLKPSSNPHSK